MTRDRELLLLTLLVLLEEENQALRSVLSEFGSDFNHFTQYLKAEDLRRVIEQFGHKV